jgi:hypothetical protein
MERFFSPQLDLDQMIVKVKEMMRILSHAVAEMVRYGCLTGLRSAEACESVRLINTGVRYTEQSYYNQEHQT